MDSLLKGECTMKCRAEYENELAKTRDQRVHLVGWVVVNFCIF